MDKLTYDRILRILHQEVKPALGCTEPIAVAIAVSRAAAEGKSPVERVVVRVSPNILKNAMGVGIPGTGLTGLPVAAALAVICGKWEYGLEVLRNVNSEAAAAAKKFVDEGRVSVALSDSPKMLYAEAECFFTDGSSARAIIEDHHDSIVYVARNGRVLSDLRSKDTCENSKEDDGRFLVLSLINEFAQTADLKDLDLMKDMVAMNTAISEEGLRGDYGLRVGKTILDEKYREVFGSMLCTRCMAMTAAASDARMAGCTMPAMSNSGSGNQGLTVSLPVIAAARHLGSSEEELIRALALSNLIAIHIKSYLGRLSALCGCVVASTGAACGIVMLRGGDVPHMGAAIKNMIGSITGMVCDGAKEGCAMKVASGVSCALQSAVLALNDICIHPTDGIIDQEVEKTIGNLGEIGSRGMLQTDSVILNIMVSK
ncbi:MAG: L-serine ammonia-lyase, iron-sulfur-dependent, subunit alpha [Bacteroidales bacterium]|nr:L-serine ammonia-lyase, iron-sulfur-dependent, subunit alpha [Bacteroidales bacterium]